MRFDPYASTGSSETAPPIVVLQLLLGVCTAVPTHSYILVKSGCGFLFFFQTQFVNTSISRQRPFCNSKSPEAVSVAVISNALHPTLKTN